MIFIYLFIFLKFFLMIFMETIFNDLHAAENMYQQSSLQDVDYDESLETLESSLAHFRVVHH
jgi:hypothetical protein